MDPLQVRPLQEWRIGNEVIIRTPQISITGASVSDEVLCHIRLFFFEGKLPFYRRYTWYILNFVNRADEGYEYGKFVASALCEGLPALKISIFFYFFKTWILTTSVIGKPETNLPMRHNKIHFLFSTIAIWINCTTKNVTNLIKFWFEGSLV